MNSGGLTGQTTIGAVDWNPIVCLGSAFSIPGLKSIGILLLTGVGITAYVRFHDKFSSKDYDERGFTRSKYGTYGTASMDEGQGTERDSGDQASVAGRWHHFGRKKRQRRLLT